MSHWREDAVLEKAKAYQQIKQQLRKRLGREWPVGARLPPIKQLADQLGAGRSSTHRAVQELVRDGMLVSRPRHGTFVIKAGGKSTPALAGIRALQGLRGRTVRVLTGGRKPDLFIERAVESALESLSAAGCSVSRGSFRAREKKAVAAVNDVEGILIINPNSINEIDVRDDQSVVLLSTAPDLPCVMPQRYDFVSVDSFEGGKLAGETLRAAGCERICYVGRIPPDLPEQAYDMASTQRLAGFEAGLGYKLDDSVKLGCDFYQTAPGAQVVAEYLALHPRPDGVFAASDEIAVGFVHGAWAHGLQPGEDYQIIGFDGQQIGRVIGGGSLTTIDAPMVEMGEMAAMMLMDRMQNPRRGVRQILHMGTVYHGVTVHQPNAEPVELPT